MLVVVTGDKPDVTVKSRRTRTFRYLGEVAAEWGLRVFFTTPKHFRLVRGRSKAKYPDATHGWLFDPGKGHFVDTKIRLHPDEIVIYDAMYLKDLREHRTIYRGLYRGWVRCGYRFFNPILPSKDRLYRDLQKRDLKYVHLPRTWLVTNPESVLARLETSDRLWLKPIVGSGGRNILVVSRESSEEYRVVSERFFDQSVNRVLSRKGLLTLLKGAMQKRTYMAQEEIPLIRTFEGKKVDFRVTVVRAGGHKWRAIAVKGREGKSGSELTNFHAGGRAVPLDDLLSRLPLAEGEGTKLKRQLEIAAILVARVLQRRHKSLGLLGIDLGITSDGRIYVYDFNGRPGRDILNDSQVRETMDTIVRYCAYQLRTLDR